MLVRDDRCPVTPPWSRGRGKNTSKLERLEAIPYATLRLPPDREEGSPLPS